MSDAFSGDLTGRVALVTRVEGPIGQAVGRALSEAGAAVAVNGLNPARVDALVRDIRAAGGQALGWNGDISNRMQVSAMIEAVRETFGGLHIVVHVADVMKRAPLLTLDAYDWQRVLALNLTGAFYFTQFAARVMSQEGGGVIVYVAAGDGQASPQADGAAYTASHAGLLGLMRESAHALRDVGVRVNVVLSQNAAPEALAQRTLALCKGDATQVSGRMYIVSGSRST